MFVFAGTLAAIVTGLIERLKGSQACGLFYFVTDDLVIARNPRSSLITYLAIFAHGVPSIATAAVLYLPSLLLVLSG